MEIAISFWGTGPVCREKNIRDISTNKFQCSKDLAKILPNQIGLTEPNLKPNQHFDRFLWWIWSIWTNLLETVLKALRSYGNLSPSFLHLSPCAPPCLLLPPLSSCLAACLLTPPCLPPCLPTSLPPSLLASLHPSCSLSIKWLVAPPLNISWLTPL